MQCQEDYIALCRFIRHQLAHQQADGGGVGRLPDIRQQKMPTLPYIFQTPKGLLIDLRLFSRCEFFICPSIRLELSGVVCFHQGRNGPSEANSQRHHSAGIKGPLVVSAGNSNRSKAQRSGQGKR